MSICAPGIGDNISCLLTDDLLECVKYYNSKSMKNKHIRTSYKREIIRPEQYRKYLLNELYNRLQCESEKCVVDKLVEEDFITNLKFVHKLKKETFRPEGPGGRFTWLNTFNINDVMAQYFIADHGRLFYGAIPMDFASLHHTSHIYNEDYQKLLDKNIYKLGIIFNLDNHDQGGSHWVGLYINLIKGQVYYFDSVAQPPEQRVKDLTKKVAYFFKSKNMQYKLKYNKIQHQRKNTECGVYSIYFLLRMCIDYDFDEHCRNIISDDLINKIRDHIFYPRNLV